MGGSLIIRGSVRYDYKHSILGYEDGGSQWGGNCLEKGHRVSVMIRVSGASESRGSITHEYKDTPSKAASV
jgi:hypothetical protein